MQLRHLLLASKVMCLAVLDLPGSGHISFSQLYHLSWDPMAFSLRSGETLGLLEPVS